MDNNISSLLADHDPQKARNFVSRYEELRIAAWADAHRAAVSRAASGGHIPHLRGQLRYQYSEQALVQAAQEAGCGYLPFTSNPPGAICILARVGKFAIASLKLDHDWARPRPSTMRALLARPNGDLDPQGVLFETTKSDPKTTELAYFGCLVAVPMRRDPTVPAVLAFAVPSASLDRWLCWIPMERLNAALLTHAERRVSLQRQSGPIVDRAFPKLRLPKKPDESAGSGKPE